MAHRGFERRRSIAGVAAAPLLAAAVTQAPAQESSAPANSTATLSGRRKLGTLEVSSVGLGVQNMHRTYQTTIPHRPEMINIIRTAFDRGVTFFDTAEAYGPHECERILGEAIDAVPRPSRDHLEVRLEHRSGNRRAAPGTEQPSGAHQACGRRLAQAPAHRSHRPALPAPRRSAGADRGRRRRHQGPHGPGQGPALGSVGDGAEHACAVPTPPLPVTAVQSEYSMLWRGPEQEVLPLCEELGIGFVPWSPLGVGFLTGAIDARTRFAEGDIRAIEGRFCAGEPAAQSGAGRACQEAGPSASRLPPRRSRSPG